MPKHSIILLELSVEHFATRIFGHVANFSSQQYDLITLWVDFLRAAEAAGGDVDRERYFLPQHIDLDIAGREVKVDLEVGHTGERQTVRDTTTGVARGDIRMQDVAAAPLRCLVSVPANGRVAWMALEMAGQRSVTGHLSTTWKRDFRQQTRGSGFKLNLLNLNDAGAWEQFVEQADLLEVIFRKMVRPPGDRAAQPRLEEYVVRATEGAVLPKGWLARLRQRRLQPSEVLSVDIGDPDQVRVVVDVAGRTRTLQIGQTLPTFTYEIDPGSDERPVSSRFYDVARELVAGQASGEYGETPRVADE